MFGHDQDRGVEGFFECDGLFLLRFQVLRSLSFNYCVVSALDAGSENAPTSVFLALFFFVFGFFFSLIFS